MDFISREEFNRLITDSFARNGLKRFLQEEIIKKFYEFTQLLVEENAHTNLTAIRSIPDIIDKHYADCLLAESAIPQNRSLLDIGCGGGFPTIPLAIVRPDLVVTAVDSTQKKINFVKKAADQLKLSNVTPICGRIEDLKDFRESFDIVTSRAVAQLNVLSELSIPYVKENGLFVSLKGALGREELHEAQKSIQTLGGSVLSEFESTLSTGQGQEQRFIIVIRKNSRTPAGYPRQYSQIIKKPL